ncbi:RNA polymerase sigma factor [Chitinophaga sancti]|uniref:Sigma factor n=1 Tax=Chitinophaga sancti TaxID=1004 RepID=A0A1K1SN54_9BACT|nr:sigma factor [Chitinophaga sancti]WQD63893.1 sigma factor [Chitinophaga sancti]WQG90482.1 sigma factor [Chitinophaga sancti]SFW85317.1 Sigma-70 region 2 [Chitinophaga sancti]
MTDTEQEIIRKCIAGDRASQGRLYQFYARKMMWYAKNREEGEEILQDGFVRVFKYLHRYRNKGSLEGWIRKELPPDFYLVVSFL